MQQWKSDGFTHLGMTGDEFQLHVFPLLPYVANESYKNPILLGRDPLRYLLAHAIFKDAAKYLF